MLYSATHKLSIAFVMLSAFCIATPAKAQSTEELIVQLPGISEKNFADVAYALSKITGVVNNGYCNSTKCFFLVIDRNINPDNSGVVSKIKSLEFDFHVKEGVTIQKAIDDCNDFKRPETDQDNNTNSPD